MSQLIVIYTLEVAHPSTTLITHTGYSQVDSERQVNSKGHITSFSVVHPARRGPIHIQTAIKRETDKMLSLDVIAPVEEPTDWVSSLAYTQKTNGRWRIYLEPKDLNIVIKRLHHHIPTLDGITHKFAREKFFSKLDAKHTYWSIS